MHICSRTGDVIEPRLAPQWFLDTRMMHSEAKKALEDEQLDIFPTYEKNKLMEWLNNQEPWCLSRQLLWGHPIPAYTKNKKYVLFLSIESLYSRDWVVADSPQEAAKLLGLETGETPERDKDVLDTWFR